jgi:hypothetical protein
VHFALTKRAKVADMLQVVSGVAAATQPICLLVLVLRFKIRQVMYHFFELQLYRLSFSIFGFFSDNTKRASTMSRYVLGRKQRILLSAGCMLLICSPKSSASHIALTITGYHARLGRRRIVGLYQTATVKPT